MHIAVQTCVPLLAAGLGAHNLSGIHVWVNTCGGMGCSGLADPASVSEAATQTPIFGSKLWKRQQGFQF